jgi:hypothetical protein
VCHYRSQHNTAAFRSHTVYYVSSLLPKLTSSVAEICRSRQMKLKVVHNSVHFFVNLSYSIMHGIRTKKIAKRYLCIVYRVLHKYNNNNNNHHHHNHNNNNVHSTLTSKDLAGSSGRRPQYDAGINLNQTTAHNSLPRGRSENTNVTEWRGGRVHTTLCDLTSSRHGVRLKGKNVKFTCLVTGWPLVHCIKSNRDCHHHQSLWSDT